MPIISGNVYLPGGELVALAFLSLWGTMRDNLGSINGFIPPWVRPWEWMQLPG